MEIIVSKNYNTLLGKLSKAKPLATRNELENRVAELEKDVRFLLSFSPCYKSVEDKVADIKERLIQ
jgi:hypothetical protein